MKSAMKSNSSQRRSISFWPFSSRINSISGVSSRKETHHAVIARAQQASFVLRIVGKVAAALGDIEGIGENGSETFERGFITVALGGGNNQIGDRRRALWQKERPSAERLPGEARDISGISGTPAAGRYRCADRWDRYRAGARRIRCSFQFSKGCDAAGRPFTMRRGELHRRMSSDLDHEIAHLDALARARHRLDWRPARASARHIVCSFDDGTDRVFIVQNLPDHGQIFRADFRIGGDGCQAWRRACRERRDSGSAKRPAK